ncbi:MAG: type I-E CRISPR-associated protein Cse1/CasA [Chloroflexota bacterium]
MNNSYSFNLIDERWIPCIRADDGQLVTLSLRDTLAESHTLYDIAGDTPLQTAALYRLLIAVLLRVYRPAAADFALWDEMWRSPGWDMGRIDAYLSEWHHRFDLFATERPFYQSDSDDSRVRPKPITSLKYGNGFLHNPLFDHDNEEKVQAVTAAEAGRNLVAVQAFGLGGGHKGMFSDAAWSKGIIFFVQGNSLKETLFLNLLPYPDADREISVSDDDDDAPAWEQTDPVAEKNGVPLGYLDYLTWHNRRILLFPERQEGQIIVSRWQVGGGALLAADINDPLKFYAKHKKEGLYAYQFDESRGLWPNSYALFAPTHLRNDRYSIPPATFSHLRLLIKEAKLLEPHVVYRCKALGQGKDQAKVEYLREERFPFPLRYLVDEDLRERFQSALLLCDSVAFHLRGALRRVGFYLYVAKPDESSWKSVGINPKASKLISDLARTDIDNWVRHTEADTYFWSALDVPFQEFIVRLAGQDGDNAVKWWREQVRAAATGAFAKAKEYAHESDRAHRAIIEGQGYLVYQLKQLIGQEVKNERRD